MENVKVSVIVPAYNVKMYVEKCVKSLMNQTFSDYEIILVDDGSTDGTVEICDELAECGKVRVFHKENGGLSDARNFGLNRAFGDYITFVDSDDYVAPTYLEELYEPVKKEKVDVVIAPLCYFFENKEPAPELAVSGYCVISAEEAVKRMLNREGIGHCSCAKLFKRTLWEQVRFPVGWLYEDYLTTFLVMENAVNAAIVNNATYFYLQREDSIMHYKCNEKTVKLVDVTEQVTPQIIKKWPELEIEALGFQVSQCLKCQQHIINESPAEFLDVQKRIKGIVKINRRKLLFSNKTLFKDKIKMLFFGMGPYIFKKVYNIFDGTKKIN